MCKSTSTAVDTTDEPPSQHPRDHSPGEWHLAQGELLYVHTNGRLVPAKALGRTTGGRVQVMITAGRGTYWRGQRTTVDVDKVVPRDAVRFRRRRFAVARFAPPCTEALRHVD